MKNILSISFLLFSLSGLAQLISIKPQDVDAGAISFDSAFIKANKIKSLVIYIVDKPDGSVIIDKGGTQGYEFDSLGKVSSFFYTSLREEKREEVSVPALKKRGRIIRPESTRTISRYFNDTVHTKVFYDSLQRIIAKRWKNGEYYDAWYYEYDQQGRLSREVHCKENNVSSEAGEFKLGVQKIISSESFKYEMLTPIQLRKISLNDEGREYKKTIINFDIRGNRISETQNFTVGWMRQETSFEYDSKNFLNKRRFVSNISGDLEEEREYQYDGRGLFMNEKFSKNSRLISEIGYLFDEKGLIKSHVNRDYKNASIQIAKYVYTFY